MPTPMWMRCIASTTSRSIPRGRMSILFHISRLAAGTRFIICSSPRTVPNSSSMANANLSAVCWTVPPASMPYSLARRFSFSTSLTGYSGATPVAPFNTASTTSLPWSECAAAPMATQSRRFLATIRLASLPHTPLMRSPPMMRHGPMAQRWQETPSEQNLQCGVCRSRRSHTVSVPSCIAFLRIICDVRSSVLSSAFWSISSLVNSCLEGLLRHSTDRISG